MPDRRTTEELKEIYKDLLEMREVANKLNKLGRFINVPFNGIPPGDEKKAFYQQHIDAWMELLITEKVTSCECQMQLREKINSWKSTRDASYNPIFPSPYQRTFNQIMANNGLPVNKLIAKIKLVIDGAADQNMTKIVNETLDHFGNCKIAMDADLLDKAKQLAYNFEKITISSDKLRVESLDKTNLLR